MNATSFQRPSVLWFTGLSGAGKSTIAAAVRERLEGMVPVELIDGDTVRTFSPAGFTREERNAHVRRVGFLASRLEHHGVTSLCALISPYESARQEVRRMCRRYIEIYVSTPLGECERRDVKGLYRRARQGQILQFTGIDDPYEPPAAPDLCLDTTTLSLDESVSTVVLLWARRTALPIEVMAPLTQPAHSRVALPAAV
jgi:adenylylsulfate kinase